MGYFYDNKLIDCSLTCGMKNIDTGLCALFLDAFSKMDMEEKCDILSLFEKLGYEPDKDLRLTEYFKYYHSMKCAVYKYYKDSELKQRNDMVIFYYYDANLIPTVRKIGFTEGLYKDSVSQYAVCDADGIKKEIQDSAPKNYTFKINLRRINTIIPVINHYRTADNKIFMEASSQKTDYLEYLFLFNWVFLDLKASGMKLGIRFDISFQKPEAECREYKIEFRKTDCMAGSYMKFKSDDNIRGELIAGNYYVENFISKCYTDLVVCNTLVDVPAYSFPDIMKVCSRTREYLTDLPVHKPVPFHDYLNCFENCEGNIDLMLEYFHILKYSICDFNYKNNKEKLYIALFYDEKKIPNIIKLADYEKKNNFDKELSTIIDFEDRLYKLIQNSKEEISFNISLRDMSGFDELLNTVVLEDLHFPQINDYWEYVNVMTAVQKKHPDTVDLQKIQDGDFTVYKYKKNIRPINADVKISLTEIQKKLCIWLAYKGKATREQIKYFLLNEDQFRDRIMLEEFAPLYQKGLIETGRENDRNYYICNFNVDEIKDSSVTVHYENIEEELIKKLECIAPLNKIIRNQREQLIYARCYYDMKNKYRDQSQVKNQIGLCKVHPYSFDYYFKFDTDSIYSLDLDRNPELMKIAKCVQRAMDGTLHENYRKIFRVRENDGQLIISSHFIHVIPTPILRILFGLDPSALKTDFTKCPEIVFSNISSKATDQLKRIFTDKLFVME